MKLPTILLILSCLLVNASVKSDNTTTTTPPPTTTTPPPTTTTPPPTTTTLPPTTTTPPPQNTQTSQSPTTSTTNPKTTSDSKVANILRQLSAFLPHLTNDVLGTGLGLTNSQLKEINNIVQSLMKSVTTSPFGLKDILASLQSSDLFRALAKSLGSGSTAAKLVCDEIHRLKPEVNVTFADFLAKRNQSIGNFKQFSSTDIADVREWCENNDNGTNGVGPRVNPELGGLGHYWTKCRSDVRQTLQGITTGQNWAMQMLDATAKPGSGIMRGHLVFTGNYKQCQEVSSRDPNPFATVEGNMCRVLVKIPTRSSTLEAAPWLAWDVCMPKSCQQQDLQMLLLENSLQGGVWVVCTEELEVNNDPGAIAAIAVLCIFGALMMAGTCLDICISDRGDKRKDADIIKAYSEGNDNKGYDNKEEEEQTVASDEPDGKTAAIELTQFQPDVIYENAKNLEMGSNGSVKDKERVTVEERKEPKKDKIASLPGWQRALLAFSIPRNTEKILSVKSSPGTIGCLHGIRVLSMGWVILGHVLLFCAQRGYFENRMDVFESMNKMSFQIIINAILSVDTFFVMSGALTCYVFLKKLGKKGRITIKEFAMYYVHRYWRLTPPLLMWIMVVACLMKYIGEGRPGWSDFNQAEICRKNWWVNLLYINNVYKRNEPCVGVTWFLAHDMQFYIIAPLAMIPWVYGKRILGFLIAFILLGIHIAATSWIEMEINADSVRNTQEFQEQIYFMPYTRVGPFAIGLMLGWVLWRTDKMKVRMNKVLVFLAWFVCIATVLILVLVTYDENKDLTVDPWSKVQRAVFETLNRPCWGLAISWIVFACARGYGGFINSILAWEGWQPLSRLTYSAFLIHLTLIDLETFGVEFTRLYTTSALAYQFIGFFVMAYTVGGLLTLVVESPMIGLEKVVFG